MSRRSYRRIAGVPALTFCCLFSLLTASCASTSETAGKSELLYGTWANKEYVGTYWVCRFVYQQDGKYLVWGDGTPPDKPNNVEGRFTIDKKWGDSKGNTWYRVAGKWSFAPYSESKATKDYGLIKISSAGKVLDGEWSTVDFPTEWGSLGSAHFVYYREE